MTRKQIRDRILDSLNQSITAPRMFSLAEIDDIIQEGFELLAEEVRGVKRQALVAVRSGQSYFYTQSIAPDIMVPTRLTLMPDDFRLMAVTFRQLNDRHEEWQRVTGTTPSVWLPISWDMFGVFPHVTTGNKLLRMDYIAWPRQLIDDQDSLEFQDSDQDAAVLYGVYRGLLQMWDFDAALQAFQVFIERFGDAKFKSDIRRGQAQSFTPSRHESPQFETVRPI